MCPTSNLQTKALKDMTKFPFMDYLNNGINVTLNTDDMAIERTTLPKEFEYMEKNFGLNSEQEIVKKIDNAILSNPYIFLYLFYGIGKMIQLNDYITNKLINKKLFIKALNSINEFYLNQFMIDCEDGLINFMLYKLCNSLYFTRKIGYYYVKSESSITNDSGFKKRLKSNFLYFKFIFESTKNNNNLFSQFLIL
jgi:hypothetical protein